VLRWPHGGHGDCASARRLWRASVGPAGWGARRRAIDCVAAPPEVLSLRSLYWVHGRCSERHDGCANAESASLALECGLPCTGGAEAFGRPCPTPGGAMGAVLGVPLRNYGFTDLPPSLPLPRSDPVTRIRKSSYRRNWIPSERIVFRSPRREGK
jgi:hypothetical protein